MKVMIYGGAIVCAMACSGEGAAGFFLGGILGGLAGLLTYLSWQVFQKLLVPLVLGVTLLLAVVGIVASGAK